MIFSYDKFKRLERPILYLAKPDKTYIGAVQNTEFKMELCFSSKSQITFKSYKYINGEEMPYYDDIEVLKLIEAQYVSWFQIVECTEHGEGHTKYKEVTALSLENELGKKMLNSFGSMGVETDSQGGLDRYCLYNVMDTDHSILHIVMEKAPLWTVGHIDPEITTEYRSFNQDSIDAYNFLTGDVASAFECIFIFDTFERKINAYKVENIGKDTVVLLSHRNLIDHAEITENSDNIYTVMTVCGGDYDGHPLQITDVNPTGTSYICDFSYYYNWFSDELKAKITEYQEACESRKGGYASAMSALKNLLVELEDINNRVPATEHSTNWNEYGVVELQTEFDYYNQKMSLYLDGQNETLRTKYWNILYGSNGIEKALATRKAEYSAKQTEIENQKAICDNFVLNMEEFLGNDLYKELSAYFYYTDFIDDTFVATTAMTDSEILEMKMLLLEEAERKLAEVSKPSYTMTIDSANFLAMPEYEAYAEQLELGCMVTVEFEEDVFIQPRLLKMSIDWEKLSDFTLTFSSKTKLDDGLLQLEEISRQNNNAITAQTLSGIGWDAAKNQTTVVSDFMNSAFNAAKNSLFSGNNMEVLTDGSGTRFRKWDEAKNAYSRNQMWQTNNGIYMTDDAWATVNVAIGELNIGKDANGNDMIMYGIAAPLLLGKMTISEAMYIMNQSNTFSINNDGLLALSQNQNIAIKMNPNNTSGLIEIVKDYNTSKPTKVFYTDSNGNLNITGNINATGGKFGNWIIGTDSIYYKHNTFGQSGGMYFGVNGLSVGSAFKVDANGKLTATSGTFSGSINSSSITTTNISASSIDGGSIDGTAITGGSITGSTIIATHSAFDQATLKSCYIIGDLTANDASITVTASSGNQMKLSEGKLTTNGKIGIYNNDIYCNMLFINSSTEGIDKEGNSSDATSISSFVTNKAYDAASDAVDDALSYLETRDVSWYDNGNGNARFSGGIAASTSWVLDNFERTESSDFRLKYNLKKLDDTYIQLLRKLKLYSYKFKDTTEDNLTHCGVLAQELLSAMDEVGIDVDDQAFVTEYNTRKYKDEGMYTGEKAYRVNYRELCNLLLLGWQDLDNRLKNIENTIEL